MAVLQERHEVASWLAQIGVSPEELIDIVAEAVRAHGNAIAIDPVTSAGQLAYIYGTRALRRVFLAKGWELRRTDNIESVFNPRSGMKIVYQNAERAGDVLRDPLAKSKRGNGTTRAVDLGQGELFPSIRKAEIRELTAAHWYLFTYIAEGDVRAELSFPKSVENEQFLGFWHRVILLQKGDWAAIDIRDDKGDEAPEFDVDVTRKR